MTEELSMKNSFLINVFAILILLNSGLISAQQPTSLVPYLGTNTITIDGDASDPGWAAVATIDIDVPFQQEQPTLTSATWKVTWNNDGMYILVEVNDDVWMPSWVSGLADWESDKVEVYIDVTDPQKDGGGASGGNGNYQVGPNFTQNTQGTETDVDGLGTVYASTFDGAGKYIMEYYVPFTTIPDNNSNVIDPTVTTTIGFDVTVIDLDDTGVGRNRAVWANAGAIDESWNNTDDVGLITFVNMGTELIAFFSASKTTTGPGKDIQFTDYSNGTPTEWLWDFGDGSSSTEQNPVHSYSNLGDYTVSLTVSDADDSTSTAIKTNFISITDASLEPTAEFSANLTSVKTDQPVLFTDESLYTPTSWTWYFGDGTASTEENPTHAYSTIGNYSVTLVAANANGTHSTQKIDYISVIQGDAPEAGFTATKTTSIIYETIQFTDRSTNYPTSWWWDFGDGNTSDEQNPLHAYNIPGTYTVSLTATNSSGESTKMNTDYIVVAAASSNKTNTLEKVRIHPNPSNGVFYLNTTAIFSDNLQIQVVDITGKVTMKSLIEAQESYKIDLSNYPKGMYFVQINTGTYLYTEKIIVE